MRESLDDDASRVMAEALPTPVSARAEPSGRGEAGAMPPTSLPVSGGSASFGAETTIAADLPPQEQLRDLGRLAVCDGLYLMIGLEGTSFAGEQRLAAQYNAKLEDILVTSGIDRGEAFSVLYADLDGSFACE